MKAEFRPTFEFQNQISPRYIEPLFLQLDYGRWYTMMQFKELLRKNGLKVEGSNIVTRNSTAWALAGLGHVKTEKSERSVIKLFQLSQLGKQLIETYGTNRELFYDLMNFIFYSPWHRTHDLRLARFWLYAAVCDALWQAAPAKTNSFALTNKLQIESRQVFPNHEPSFPERSVRAVFLWLSSLTPPFLSKCGTQTQLCSIYRSYCTPQLFHLATDLLYTKDNLRYGTSMSVDDLHIDAICRACLLDRRRFWEMAELTKATIRDFDIRKGQWGNSLILEGPPNWIQMPDFSAMLAAADTAGSEIEDNE
jgi:hypothetical protein